MRRQGYIVSHSPPQARLTARMMSSCCIPKPMSQCSRSWQSTRIAIPPAIMPVPMSSARKYHPRKMSRSAWWRHASASADLSLPLCHVLKMKMSPQSEYAPHAIMLSSRLGT